jgi:hypothetical protein
MMESFGLLLVLALVLGFCWSLLIGLSREGEPEDTAVANELLLQELLLEQPEALPTAGPPIAIASTPVTQDVHETG